MNLQNILILILVLGSSTIALALDKETEERAKVCLRLYSILPSAFEHKLQGKSAGEMLAPLPPKESLENSPQSKARLLGLQMHYAIEDIYSSNNIQVVTYLGYRVESCSRYVLGLSVVSNFNKVTEKLSSCKGTENTELFNCGFALANPENS
jgi:hypothetical protein|tara:strand:+ start:67 stop:522 length:456 start_codon:yes stop_codon:yes gene_type:complete